MLLKEIKEFIESPTRFINLFPLTNGQNFILVWILINPISPNYGCDMVLKDELDVESSNNISFLNKNLLFIYFIYIYIS